MTLHIRLVEPHDDLAALGLIIQKSYFTLPGYPRDPDYDLKLADVGSRLAQAEVWAAFLDDRPVGCLTFTAEVNSEHAEHGDSDASTFRYFGVDATAQGSGVGTAMVNKVIHRTVECGRRRIRIHTLQMMTSAQRLYERLGFVRDPNYDALWDDVVGLAYRYDIDVDAVPRLVTDHHETA